MFEQPRTGGEIVNGKEDREMNCPLGASRSRAAVQYSEEAVFQSVIQ